MYNKVIELFTTGICNFFNVRNVYYQILGSLQSDHILKTYNMSKTQLTEGKRQDTVIRQRMPRTYNVLQKYTSK